MTTLLTLSGEMVGLDQLFIYPADSMQVDSVAQHPLVFSKEQRLTLQLLTERMSLGVGQYELPLPECSAAPRKCDG